MKSKAILPVLLIAASVVLAVISYIVLPDVVVMQISLSGSDPTTMPKLLAVALPLALGAGGALVSLNAGNDVRVKSLVVSVVGLVAFVFTLVVNLV